MRTSAACQAASHAARCRLSSSSYPVSSARSSTRRAVSEDGARVRAETIAASRSTVAGSPASRRPPITSRACCGVRTTGDPGAGLVVTASTWPPPLRPRVRATSPGGSSSASNSVSLVAPPACVTPIALCHTSEPEKSSGVASARAAMI